MRRIVLALLACTALCAQDKTAKHPFTFEDMMKLERVGEPVPSPNGKWVVFSAVHVDLATNKKTPHLWIVPADGSAKERKLVWTEKGEDRPRWSPDGKHLSFLASYDGAQQVWVAAFDDVKGEIVAAAVAPAGSAANQDPSPAPSSAAPLGMTIQAIATAANPWAHKVTSISTEADGQQWSPDGKFILFTSSVYPECDTAAAQDVCNKSKDDALAASKVKAKIFTKLLYRHWNAYTQFKRSHLFVQPVAADGTASGKAIDITPGDHDVPPFSLGGQDDYAISPDGKEVAFTSNLDEVEATSTNSDVLVVPIHWFEGERSSPVVIGSSAKKISTSSGADATPLYSPDGKYIAFRSQGRAGYESDRFRLMLYERATGKITELTKGFDRWVGSYVWAPDSNRIYLTAESLGQSPVFLIDLMKTSSSSNSIKWLYSIGGLPRTTEPASMGIVFGAHVDDLAISFDGKRLFGTTMTGGSPNEISANYVKPCDEHQGNDASEQSAGFQCRSSLAAAWQLTHVNDSVLKSVEWGESSPFVFSGADETKVQGFLVKPPNFDEHKKYPVKFLIHGGPQGA